MSTETETTSGGTSLLDTIRAQHQERVEDRRLTVPVRSWNGVLAIRFRVPDMDMFTRVVGSYEQAQRSSDAGAELKGLDAACDMLILSCDEALVRSEETGEYEELSTEAELGPEPVRFDEHLATALRIEIPKEVPSPARFVVREVFGGNEFAVIAIFQRVWNWVTESGPEGDPDF